MVDNIEKDIINIIKILSQAINGDTNLSDLSSLTDAITEVLNKSNNANWSLINLNRLATIIDTHTRQINNLSTDKTSKDYVDGEINSVKDSLGIVPKQLQTQDIPLDASDDSKNLNYYKTPGLYRSKDAANTSNLLNVPDGANRSAFNLVVLLHMNNSAKQILLTSENNANGNRIYMRNYLHSAGQWSEWYELYGDHNLSPLQMQIEWSDGSTPTTYTLLQK